MGRITLDKVAKSFGEVEVIPPLDLTIEDGEFVVFVGPSGCGKSTLLRLIAGLEDVSAGVIRIDGQDATSVPPAKRGLAMVFQSYALYPHMSVRKNIAFPLRMAGLDAAEQERRVKAAADVLNLTDYLDRRPGQLSGGQRQRVAIGRAIVREPSAFLFDEPLSNLDAALRVGMRLEISELHNRLKTTMIYVTHDQVEAMTMADKIVVLRAGNIEQVGSPLELYRAPRNLFVAGFIGSPKMNLIGGDIAARHEAETIGIRPEHISVSPDTGEWRGTVGVSEHLGSDTFFHVACEGIPEPVTVRVGGEVSLHHGDAIWLTPDPDHLHRFDSEGLRVA
jgi:multiple sugar transport system ATP-binding protein